MIVYLGGLKRKMNAVELWHGIPPIFSAHFVSLKPTFVAYFADILYATFPPEESCWDCSTFGTHPFQFVQLIKLSK
jgi:hypothetical protein